MGKKKTIPKQPLRIIRKNSNGLVWPSEQIPMLEVSIEKITHDLETNDWLVYIANILILPKYFSPRISNFKFYISYN